MRLASASVLTFTIALTTTLMAEIPKQAQWEITFAQVEAAAALPDLSRTEPDVSLLEAGFVVAIPPTERFRRCLSRRNLREADRHDGTTRLARTLRRPAGCLSAG